MAYISSNDNRLYVTLEQNYGNAAAMLSENRIPAVKLTIKQQVQKTQRQDKTGSRTFLGDPVGLRKSTTFKLTTYMTNWADQTAPPPQGPLLQASLGGTPATWSGGTAASASGSQLTFTAAHGLAPGQAVTSGGDIRFVTAVVSPETVQLNAPFTATPEANSPIGKTVLYSLASELGSVTIGDYWSPGGAAQRLLTGAAIDQMKLTINGDYHQFEFTGMAYDVLDSSSFQTGEASLTTFPTEPALQAFNYSLVPGNLGQVWLGNSPTQFLTITKADLTFGNKLDLRANEFGSSLPRGISPGTRSVTLNLNLYQQDDSPTQALYQAARQRSPLTMMIQLGQQQGELLGVFMQSVVPEVPDFDDSGSRQQWQFQNCRAQGNGDDEIYIAFG
jgi:hypothetical protein